MGGGTNRCNRDRTIRPISLAPSNDLQLTSGETHVDDADGDDADDDDDAHGGRSYNDSRSMCQGMRVQVNKCTDYRYAPSARSVSLRASISRAVKPARLLRASINGPCCSNHDLSIIS